MKRALMLVNDPAAPSFRHRWAAHVPALEAAGWTARVEVFPRRRYGARVLRRRALFRSYDVVVIAKLKLEWGERALARRWSRRIVYDFDDAVYVAKPDRPGGEPDRSRARERKFRAMCRMADLVVAGNPTLAAAAAESARRVEVLPTAIETSAYPAARHRDGDVPTVVWIGTGGNLLYLEGLRGALAEVRRNVPGARLKVICDRSPRDMPLPVDFVEWSERTEAEELSRASVGVMPLDDDEWTRGKGGFKLLQYMAAGLPVVASPVGINRDIVRPGETGWLAGDAAEWARALTSLLLDAPERRRLGGAGRERASRDFGRAASGRRLAALLDSL